MNMRNRPVIIIIVLVLLWTFLVGGCPLPAHAQTCIDTKGAIVRKMFYSAILGANIDYAVYTPRCYNAPEYAEHRFPVVYLLHGSDAYDTDYWLRLGLQETLDKGIAAGDMPPMLVVMPFGDWIANTNQFGAVSWGNIIVRELLPAVETVFRIDGRRESRAIGGISRGGFWAFNIAFQRPDLFGVVGGHSPYFWYGIEDAANPLVMVDTLPDLDTLRLSLDCGADDPVAENMTILHNKLEARQIPHMFTIYPEGAHDAAYWSAHLEAYMKFYGQDWFGLL